MPRTIVPGVPGEGAIEMLTRGLVRRGKTPWIEETGLVCNYVPETGPGTIWEHEGAAPVPMGRLGGGGVSEVRRTIWVREV